MQRVKQEVRHLMQDFDFLKCIETGTIRSFHEKHESTRHISEALGDKGHLKSIDIELKHIETSKKICGGECKNVTWIESDSLKYFNDDSDMYHFVLLDSMNDSNHIFNEFKLIAGRVYTGGSIMIDDAGTDSNGNYKAIGGKFQPRKGWAVVDWCKAHDVDWRKSA